MAAPSLLGELVGLDSASLCTPNHRSPPAATPAPVATDCGAASTAGEAASSLSPLAAPFFPRDCSLGRPKALCWAEDVFGCSDCDSDASPEPAVPRR